MVPDEVSLHCPHCGRFTAVTPARQVIPVRSEGMPNNIGEKPIREFLQQDPFYRYGSGSWWMGKCNACQQPLLVRDRGGSVFPTPQPGPVADEIPQPMRDDLREAKACLAASTWNAAVVMARRALQCAAVEQGAPHGDQLWKQIKWLDDNRKITAQQREWADAARWVGNHGAHDTEPNVAAGQPVITNVTKDDAVATVDLVEHLFETLYVATTRAREQLAKRGKA